MVSASARSTLLAFCALCAAPGAATAQDIDPYERRLGSGAGLHRNSLALGLQWLAAHQDDDGKWDPPHFMKHDRGAVQCDGPGNPTHTVAITSLALLAFLGAGHNQRTGRHRPVVRRALHWLAAQQGPDGRIGDPGARDYLLDHAIATLALCEAHGFGRDMTVREAAQLGIDYLLAQRGPAGAWGTPPGSEQTAVTVWAVHALTVARWCDLRLESEALTKARSWLTRVTSKKGRVDNRLDGEEPAAAPGPNEFPCPSSQGLAAAGLFCRILLGQPGNTASADLVVADPPVWGDERTDLTLWYFGSLAVYQMAGRWGDSWRSQLLELRKAQRRDGVFAGSWDPVGPWGEVGGRVHTTAMATLALESYGRYTRLAR